MAQRSERIASRFPRRLQPVPRKVDAMPTDIERSYLAQGYVLPEGLTWEDVAEQRGRWEIDPIFVPVARVPGACIGWGVPFVNGVPLAYS